MIGCVGGVVVGGLVVSLAVPMFTLAGGQGAVLRDAVAYGQTLFAGIVIIWLFNMTAAVSRGSGDMRTPFIAIVLAAVTYWVTSAPLIDGFGTVGSAMALLVGFGGGLAVMVAAILFGFTPVPLVWGGVPWAVIGPILRNGLLAASQSVATILAAMLATAYVARLGDAALAGYGIGVRLELLLVPVVFGIGGAAIAVTGAHVGGGRRALAIRGAWLAAFMAAALVGAIGVLTALWPELWRGWFTDIPAVAAVTDHYLRVVGPFYGFFRSWSVPVLRQSGAEHIVLAGVRHVFALGRGCRRGRRPKSAGRAQPVASVDGGGRRHPDLRRGHRGGFALARLAPAQLVFEARLVQAGGRQGENFMAVVGDRQRVLELGRKRTVAGYRGPTVVEQFDREFTGVDHRFDGEKHARPKTHAGPGRAVMQHAGRGVENLPEAMAAKIAHHGKAISLDERLDGVANIAQGRARLGGGDAAHHRFIGHVDQPARLDVDFTDRKHPAAVTMPTVQRRGHVDIDDIAVLQAFAGVRNAMATT